MLISDLWGISFHAVVVFGLGRNLLFKSMLGRCDASINSDLFLRVRFLLENPKSVCKYFKELNEKKIRQNKSLGEEKRVKSYLFQQRRLFNWQSERKMTKKMFNKSFVETFVTIAKL